MGKTRARYGRDTGETRARHRQDTGKKQIEKKQQHTHTDEICTQILKNGKPCKCKIYDKTTKLCKRHFNLKNKQLNITSL